MHDILLVFVKAPRPGTVKTRLAGDLGDERAAAVYRAIAEEEIQQYVATNEPMDKAGGYAIQGRAAVFVRSLSGSYSGVMGLPLYETAELLAGFGRPVL